ncbi:MAG: glycosyl hydrolase, partial [Treponema sp.]|nr:glycosyl hydrolase [Treponema sp.]
MAEQLTAEEMVREMTLEEKASLCSGQSFWHSQEVKRLGLPPFMMVDGPHGLRKQFADSGPSGVFKSALATCFPTASGTANSFNPALLRDIGRALGEECLQESVSVILGPGLNIKRSPLCGRNFEYFSEDPYLCGELSAALIDGIQSQGVGVSMKHYAANNQEWCRMAINAIIDERALREIYLTAFEKSVKQGRPWTVMCSYNRINGTYASENKWLLTEVLRDEWGFDGIVISDWGAVVDRVKGVKAGLDVEMPGNGGINDAL